MNMCGSLHKDISNQMLLNFRDVFPSQEPSEDTGLVIANISRARAKWLHQCHSLVGTSAQTAGKAGELAKPSHLTPN